jgi:hypothetical protein
MERKRKRRVKMKNIMELRDKDDSTSYIDLSRLNCVRRKRNTVEFYIGISSALTTYYSTEQEAKEAMQKIIAFWEAL